LAEKHVAGASVGPTARAIIADQFTRLRDGDRFWYQNTLKGADLQAVQRTTLSSLIARNSGISNMQANAFFFKAEINGQVFADVNKDGRLTRGETPLGKVKVELVSTDDGSVVATTTTNPQGQYRFGVVEGLRLGVYQVRVTLPDGKVMEGPKATLTRGDTSVQVQVAVPPKPAAVKTTAEVTMTPPRAPAGLHVDGSLAFRQMVGAMLVGQMRS